MRISQYIEECIEISSNNLILHFLAAKDFIEKLLVVDKAKRMTAIDALCHPWVVTQGGALPPPDNMPEHRKQLRQKLEAEAKSNMDQFQNSRYS